MKVYVKHILSALVLPVFCLGAVGILSVSIPLGGNVPINDAALFFYYGSQMLGGETLYVDLWDNKPPLIFFINMLGVKLGGGGYWGIWLIEVVVIVCSVISLYILLRSVWEKRYMLYFALAMYLLCLMVLYLSLSTEEFAQLFSLLTLFLGGWVLKGQRVALTSYLIGVCAGISFFLKPTAVGMFIASLIFLFALKRFSPSVKFRLSSFVLFSFLGLVTVGGLIMLFLLKQGTLDAFIDAVFVNGFYYSKGALLFKLLKEVEALLLLVISGPALIAGVGWAYCLITLLREGRNAIASRRFLWPVWIAFIDLPIELGIVGISGRANRYYFFLCLPSIAILSGWGVYALYQMVRKLEIEKRIHAFLLVAGGVLLLFIFSITPIFIFARAYYSHRVRSAMNSMFIERIRNDENEQGNVSVLVWGYYPSYYAILKPHPPTRYVNQFGLFTKGYGSAAMTKTLLSELQSTQPRYIIDTGADGENIQSFDKKRRIGSKFIYPSSALPPEIHTLEAYVKRHYVLEAIQTFPPDFKMKPWYLYKHKS